MCIIQPAPAADMIFQNTDIPVLDRKRQASVARPEAGTSVSINFSLARMIDKYLCRSVKVCLDNIFLIPRAIGLKPTAVEGPWSSYTDTG